MAKKGGKGRKGGGGGGAGPKQRKYERDNKGRFASTGSGGATARGGRLLTAKGNKRTARALAGKTKTIEAAGQKGVLAKPKGLKAGAIKAKASNKIISSPRQLTGDQKIARDVMTNKKLTSDRQRIAEMQRRGIKPGTDMVGLVAGVRAKQGGGTTARIKPAAKPAGKPARFSASELAERKGYAKQLMAQPKGVRKANYLQRKAQKNPDQLDRFKGRMKFGTQNTINNITEGRSYLTAKKSQFANTPEKRASIERSVTNSGRSLQARMKTTNLGTRLRRLNKPVTTKAAKIKGTIGKPKGLKPESTNKLKIGIFISKRRAVNAQLANKPDQAVVNIPGRFTGRAGKSFDASITRAVATVKASKDAKFKTKAEVKADQAKAKAAKEAKPKRIRSAESLRVSRAKQIEKRRSITTNPAGVRASAAAKMAANATRTQRRAAAFYKAGGKPAAAKPAAPNTVPSNKRKRVLVKANARPENLFSRATKKTPGYGTDAKANVANARKRIEEKGIKTALKSNKRSSSVASVSSKTPNQIDFNASHPSWKNPRKSSIDDRRKNYLSTAKAGHVPAHELGHIKHSPSRLAGSWDVQLRGKGQIYAHADKVVATQRLATRVSKYARTSPAEFTAETRAALSLGKKYDSKVMRLYRSTTGVKLPSVKSQLRAQGVKGAFVSPRVKSKPNRKPRPMR